MVRLSPADASTPPAPWRTLARIAAAGLACALLVLLAGWGVQRAVLGADDDQARARVETDVRETFDRMSRALREMAAATADPVAVRAAAAGDNTAAHGLLTRAGEVVARDGRPGAALTVYGADGTPVAWAGRTSELPADSLQGPEAWFLASGAQGLRLVYVQPVSSGTVRLGTIAVERPLPSAEESGDRPASGLQGAEVDAFRFPTSLAPVSIQLPLAGIRASGDGTTFDVPDPSGERLLTATIATADLVRTRDRWRLATSSLSLVIVAVTLLLLTGPLLDWRNRVRVARGYILAVVLIVICIALARLTFIEVAPASWSDALPFSAAAYTSSLLWPLLTSPFDFLLTAGTAVAVVALLLYSVEAWRAHAWRNRRSASGAGPRATYLITQVTAGVALASVLLAHEALLRDTITQTTLDMLHLSLHPWNTTRLVLQAGLVMAHVAALGLSVLVLRAAVLGWRVPRRHWRLRLVTVGCWMLPLVLWQVIEAVPVASRLPLLMAAVAAVVLAAAIKRLVARYRRGSQAFRLTLLTLPLIAPAFAFYPTVVQLAGRAKAELVETRYATEVRNQRQDVQSQLQKSRAEIDGFPGLIDLVTAKVSPGTEALADRAFRVWQTTALERYPITSSVELYGPDRRLVSRFAFNLPEDPTGPPLSGEESCDWDVFEEVAPFFAEERRVLHAGRAFCSADPDVRPFGSIVVHAMPDYENLPFISSRSPYMELLRPADSLRGEGLSGGDVEFAAYGWSRTPLYPEVGPAWSIPDDVFARVEESRTPLWATLRRGQDEYEVYLLNDRGGIYALGFPVISALGHLVNLAEVTALALSTYLLLLLANALFNWLGHRETTAPALLREVRASFYRKLFLAFVAAAFVPVVTLVLVTRNYVAGQMEASIEQEAVRTASAAGRVVEDLVAPRAAQQGLGVDDNLMVWVSRLIDQDVNMFMGARLLATSERNLFASGVLPTRTDAEVYRALGLRNEAALVTRERIGTFEYLVAATPLTVRQLGILTVPLTSRQREIDRQVDTLDRRALLAALLFIIAGAGLGYSMAERISDPVNRLTRATRRIARGDFDARIAATSSDELRRLVEAFNSMAGDLQRQRKELERTHRLEAWAEMARQVAHEIKNPLTPIQLNAEHLRRVHADRGEPLSPVLQECVSTILTQVTLLRQIASEFSNFASSPTAKPSELDMAALLREILAPYRPGLEGRIRVDVDVPATLPPVHADRSLISRALVNIVENALHAMPGAGTMAVHARQDGRAIRIRVSDTGVGMDAEALARAFEPYFSTKAAGTGLGLPIAKRNVELSGGSITMSSQREKGTTVELTLPVI